VQKITSAKNKKVKMQLSINMYIGLSYRSTP